MGNVFSQQVLGTSVITLQYANIQICTPRLNNNFRQPQKHRQGNQSGTRGEHDA